MPLTRGGTLLCPARGSALRRSIILSQLARVVLQNNGLDQFIFLRVGHLAIAILWDSVLLVKLGAPIEVQLEPGFHGIEPSFHHNELTLGHRLQLIRCHEWALYHLQKLAEVVLPSADGLGEHLLPRDLLMTWAVSLLGAKQPPGIE